MCWTSARSAWPISRGSAARTPRSASCSGRSSRRASACSTALRRRPTPTGVCSRPTVSRRGCGRSSRRSTPRTSPSWRAAAQAARAAVLETPLPRGRPRRRSSRRTTGCAAGSAASPSWRFGRRRRPRICRRRRSPARPRRSSTCAAARGCFAPCTPATRRCSPIARSAIAPGSGYDQLKVALSVGVMPMVRSDKASSGVIFTLDTESGFRDVVTVSGVVRPRRVRRPGRRHAGRVDRVQADARDRAPRHHRPPARHEGSPARVRRRQQGHAQRADAGRRARAGSASTDDDVLTLARWACLIEDALLERCRPPAADGHRVGQGRRHRRARSSCRRGRRPSIRRSRERRRRRSTG